MYFLLFRANRQNCTPGTILFDEEIGHISIVADKYALDNFRETCRNCREIKKDSEVMLMEADRKYEAFLKNQTECKVLVSSSHQRIGVPVTQMFDEDHGYTAMPGRNASSPRRANR